MRYLWLAGGTIAAIVLVVVIVGYALPVKHRATGEATVNASPEALFALITDVGRFPAWRSGLESAEVLAPVAGQTRFREVSSDGTITYLVEATEPARRVVTRIDDKSLPFGGTWTYEIIPAAAGHSTLRITEDGEVYNPLFRFVSRFIIGHDGTIRKYLADVNRKNP